MYTRLSVTIKNRFQSNPSSLQLIYLQPRNITALDTGLIGRQCYVVYIYPFRNKVEMVKLR